MSFKLQSLINLATKTFAPQQASSNITTTKLCSYLNAFTKNDIPFTLYDDLNELIDEFSSNSSVISKRMTREQMFDAIQENYIENASLNNLSKSLNFHTELKQFIYQKYNKSNATNLMKQNLANMLYYIQSDAPVLHMHLYETKQVSLSVFLLRKGTKLPLHNHPKMNGLIKIIHGKGIVNAYSPMNKTSNTNLDDIFMAKHDYRQIVSVKENSLLTLSPNQSNIHEILAVKDSDLAFLDIIAPAYNLDCEYYELIENDVKNTKPIFDISDKENETIVSLKKVECPTSYYCDTLIYTGQKVE